ncbi:MAG TPA: lytic murein transglycosylase B [Steroidobacteraceae bacterium]|nr:lytic murein transglycosylase B [Steroidobacteraceae bacterium]
MRIPPPRAALAALLMLAAAVPAAPGAPRSTGLDVTRPEVKQFIAGMHHDYGFSRQELLKVLRDAEPQARIIDIMQRPAETALQWYQYRTRFLTEERIAGGVAVWQQNREALQAIERDSGVPAQYLVAITGVETFYGRQVGGYRVLDALATLAFDYPPRAEYFRKELAQFLLLAREEHLDPREPKGSYAGAMGIPQFMPSSYRRYAVDGSGDGRRDLWTYGPDVFASIAHYLREQGWHPGEPVLADACNDMPPDDPAAATAKLADTVDSLRERGYRFDTTLPGSAAAMLVPAALENGTAWRVGYQNFYVITRYNRSLLYAMAVSDLADAIAARYKAAEAGSGRPDALVAQGQ